MSREIKFRVWDKDECKYVDGVGDLYVTINEVGTNMFHLEQLCPGRYVIELSTGLKDKYGKEIYEGDIVDYTGECTCVIQYEDEGARFIHRDISDNFPFGFNGLEEYDGKLFEVIGNIHENRELLGDEDEQIDDGLNKTKNRL